MHKGSFKDQFTLVELIVDIISTILIFSLVSGSTIFILVLAAAQSIKKLEAHLGGQAITQNCPDVACPILNCSLEHQGDHRERVSHPRMSTSDDALHQTRRGPHKCNLSDKVVHYGGPTPLVWPCIKLKPIYVENATSLQRFENQKRINYGTIEGSFAKCFL